MEMFVTRSISTLMSITMRKISLPKMYPRGVQRRTYASDQSSVLMPFSSSTLDIYQFSLGSPYICDSADSLSKELMESFAGTKLCYNSRDENDIKGDVHYWDNQRKYQSFESCVPEFVMSKSEVQKAVKLFRQDIENGKVPNIPIVSNLLYQISNLGDVECILSLQDMLMDNDLYWPDIDFFGCLQNAYFTSGRVNEAVYLLRILNHDMNENSKHKKNEFAIFFTNICIMILVHFPQKISLIEEFVEDCNFRKNFIIGHLWKCLILTNNFEKALMLEQRHSIPNSCLRRMTYKILRTRVVGIDRTCTLKYIRNNEKYINNKSVQIDIAF